MNQQFKNALCESTGNLEEKISCSVIVEVGIAFCSHVVDFSCVKQPSFWRYHIVI